MNRRMIVNGLWLSLVLVSLLLAVAGCGGPAAGIGSPQVVIHVNQGAGESEKQASAEGTNADQQATAKGTNSSVININQSDGGTLTGNPSVSSPAETTQTEATTTSNESQTPQEQQQAE